jgi:hypothetical protein
MNSDQNIRKLRDLRYRVFVGPSDKYDILGATQFSVLTSLGLREDHYFLDIGCGSLCGGRLFIPYLLPGRYHGIEPIKWLVDEGLKYELGRDILEVKKPVFDNNRDFKLTVFGRKFHYLLAHSIFTHAGRSQINKCLKEAKAVMDKSSVFVATFVVGDEDDYEEYWLDNEFSVYSWNTIKKMYNGNGFKCTRLNTLHPIGQTWVLGNLIKS